MKFIWTFLCVAGFNINPVLCNFNIGLIQNSLILMKSDVMLQLALIKRVYPVSLLDCVKACLTHSRCKSFNYHRLYNLCDLNSKDSDAYPELLRRVNPEDAISYGDISDWTQDLLVGDPCYNITCPPLYKCDSSMVDHAASSLCILTECGDPVLAANSVSTGDGTSIEQRHIVSCNDGYTLSEPGNNVIICQSNGTWTNIQYFCEKDCGTPPSLPDTTIQYNSTILGTVLEYQCVPGYTMVGSENVIKCNDTGQWTVTSFICKIMDCDTPPLLTGATISYSTTVFGTQLEYKCLSGYGMYGTVTTIKCEESGMWSTPDFTCNATDCGDPPSYVDATIQYDSTTVGTVLEYSCISGFLMSASESTITCQESGSWSLPDFVCIAQVDCGLASEVKGARQYGLETSAGANVTYLCDAGYQKQGPQYSVCDGLTGTWSSVRLTCTACSTLGSTFKYVPGYMFDPPDTSVEFNYVELFGPLTIETCKEKCINLIKFQCSVIYHSILDNYCVLYDRRVSDDLTFWHFYNPNSTMNEYTRHCSSSISDVGVNPFG